MSIILRKVGPCACSGICDGNCRAIRPNPTEKVLEILSTEFDLKSHMKRLYCINLVESKERRKAMLQIFKNIHETAKGKSLSCILIKAVSPKDRIFKDIRFDLKKVDDGFRPRCYCVSDTKTPCHRHPSRALREVEIAISLSHLQAYQRMLKNEDRVAMICEDDVIVLPNVSEILSRVLQPISDELLSTKPVIIFAGGAKNNRGLKIDNPASFELKPSRTGSYSNYCYILNHAAAVLLKSRVFPITRPDDSYKRYLINKKKITAYQICPSIVAELSSGINARPVFNRLSKQTSISSLEHSIKTEAPRKYDDNEIEKIN